ncbi:hypothetical protein ACOME3_007153 [Neoechinorhynchus agilis]
MAYCICVVRGKKKSRMPRRNLQLHLHQQTSNLRRPTDHSFSSHLQRLRKSFPRKQVLSPSAHSSIFRRYSSLENNVPLANIVADTFDQDDRYGSFFLNNFHTNRLYS